LTAVLRASLAETLQKSTEGEDSSSHSNDDNLADLSPPPGASDDDDDDDDDIDASPSLSQHHRQRLQQQQGSSSQLNGHTSRHKGNRGEKSKGDAALVNGEHVSDVDGPAAPHIGNGNENGDAGGCVPAVAADSWEAYLGPAGDPPANILIRYPDGQRDAWRQPATSRLRALVLFVGSKGFGPADYEVVTNFPRRVLSDLDLDQSLREAGLCPQETVFVQLKD
jgi:hypothetical protein